MFYTESPVGLFSIITIIAEFFSGAIIPIPLMPESLKNICYALPFRLGSDFPFRIYSGNIGMMEAFQGIAIQVMDYWDNINWKFSFKDDLKKSCSTRGVKHGYIF
jgi:ABC-2 type transport system permease protein